MYQALHPVYDQSTASHLALAESQPVLAVEHRQDPAESEGVSGEGGIMALITLLRQASGKLGRRSAVVLAGLGIFGAALFFGDSMITPAISVLSAVEGLKIVQPSLADLVVPITAVIIVLCSWCSAAGPPLSAGSSGR
jgi:hypothetical protein